MEPSSRTNRNPITRGIVSVLLLLERPLQTSELQDKLGYTTRPGIKYFLEIASERAPILHDEDIDVWWMDSPLAQYEAQISESGEITFPRRPLRKNSRKNLLEE